MTIRIFLCEFRCLATTQESDNSTLGCFVYVSKNNLFNRCGSMAIEIFDRYNKCFYFVLEILFLKIVWIRVIL
jgi:hypothetical protein